MARTIIKFSENPDLSVCTSVQRNTYQVIRDLLSAGPTTLGEVMRSLGLQSPTPLWSRLDHLQQKGILEWRAAE